MAIIGKELELEKLILKKVNNLLEKTKEELESEVKVVSEDIREFKKMAWSNINEYDTMEINQVLLASSLEEEKEIKKINRLKTLRQIENSPYFASIVFKDDDGTTSNIYISLTYLNDSKNNNIIYDWRSPIASLFYDYEVGRAKYMAPGGEFSGELLRKRQYKIKNKELIGVFDNNLNIDDEVLQEVLLESSTDKMRNVVNTIQKEQNQVIRNEENNTLIVQGIAGSGKTTVALHRIAYLLYKIKNLSSNNVLIFSPNTVFQEYISDVLPSLGEKNTLASTFTDYLSSICDEYSDIESFTSFVERYYTYLDEDKELIKYKQSNEIVNDINLYIEDYIRNALFIYDIVDGKNLIKKEELNDMLHYKYGKLPLFERVEEIALKLSETTTKGKDTKVPHFKKLIKNTTNFMLNIKDIYRNFFKSNFTKYKLTDAEIKYFIDRKELNYEDSLIYAYIKGLLNGFNYEGNIKQVIIDEAQDYNLLQYIIIKNIFKKASFTILGDINQNINPYYEYKSLEDLTNIFEDSIYIELTKTYRSTEKIVEYTNKILNLNHTAAIRKDNQKDVIIRKNIDNLKKTLIEDINYLSKYNKTAIITKDYDEASKLYELLKDEYDISLLDYDTKRFNKNLVITPAYTAKGLEFDSVIVYNNRENSYKKNEKKLLYVACTRAQHELIIYN